MLLKGVVLTTQVGVRLSPSDQEGESVKRILLEESHLCPWQGAFWTTVRSQAGSRWLKVRA